MAYTMREWVECICVVGLLCVLRVNSFMIPHGHDEDNREVTRSIGMAGNPYKLKSVLLNSLLYKNKNKGWSHGASRKCDIVDWAREECGEMVLSPEQCLQSRCCWQPSDDPDMPWCYKPSR